MQKQSLALLFGALLLAVGVGFAVPSLLADDDAPLMRWDAKDEQEVQDPAAAENANPATDANLERTAVTADPTALAADESRVDVTLRGRVIDKFQAPVAAATVWLDFGRGGQRGGGPGNRNRRVPDPVQTDREGRFAFQGQTFRNLRVSLQVAHDKHAPGLFDKELGDVTAEMDLGDLVLVNGGEVLGRVTDLDGNAIPAATIQLSPENGNPMRMLRNRENLLAAVTTDNNGYFRKPHAPVGDWSVSASAKMHTEGRSATFAVEEDQQVEVDDIRLGPGYEVTGYVRTAQGQPIAKADVSLTSQGGGRGRGGRGQGGPGGGQPGATQAAEAPTAGGPAGSPVGSAAGGGNFDWRGGGGGGGREHSTTTDEQGRFFLEHLPGVPMRLEVRADGYLDYNQDQLNITLGQQVLVSMQDGLRIAGVVTDAVDGQLVVGYAVRAVRVRGLPVPGAADIDLNAIMTQMRDGNLDEATRAQLRTQMETARSAMGDMRRGGPGGGGQGGGGPGGGGPGRDLGKPEKHPDGAFVVTGLQEGVYEVHVQSPEHARYRSAEVELRLGATAPTVAVTLDRGVYVAGVVLSEQGRPVAGAKVEMRTASLTDTGAAGGRRGRGGRGGNPNGNANSGAATEAGNAPGAGIDFAAMGRDFMRQAAGAQLTLEATTDAEGEFVVKHAPRGGYRLLAQAKGFANTTGEPFDLQVDRSGVELRLGMLGSVTGQVRGLASKEYAEARVAAVAVGGNGGGFGGMGRGMGRGGQGGPGGGGGGPFNGVSVLADGTYRIDDLAPGDYIVRSWIGSPQELMRELGPQFFSGTLTADVTVKAGEVAKFDVAVTRPMVGEVSGTVLHNGTPATGFQIELTVVDENAAAGNDRGGRGQGGGMGGRGGMFGGGRSFQAAVASSGRFSVKDVPAGNYRLRVQAGRRGGLLHEEQVMVTANVTTERNIQVTTASLQGSVTRDDGNPAELNGSLSLLPGLNTMPENFNQWRREPGNTTFDTRVQAGAFKFDTLKPGNYLMVLNIRGRERATAPLVVAPGDGQRTSIAAGKVAAAPAAPGANGAAKPNAPAGNRAR